MKLIVLSAFYFPDEIGGAEISTRILCENLVSKGHEVTVITMGTTPDKSQGEMISGVKVLRLNSTYRSRYDAQNEKGNISKVIWHINCDTGNYVPDSFDLIVQKIQPDWAIVSQTSGFGALIIPRLKNLGTKVVVFNRDYYYLNLDVSNSSKRMFDLRYYVGLLLSLRRRLQLNKSNLAVANSVYLRDKLQDACLIKQKVHVLYTDNPTWKVMKRRFASKEKYELLFCSKLETTKGTEILLRLIKTLPSNFRFTILGNGMDYEEIDHALRVRNNGRILGWVSSEECESYFEKADIFLQLSVWGEPFSRTILEAFTKGVFVCATSVGGNVESLDGDRGFLFDHMKEEILIRFLSEIKDHISFCNEAIRRSYEYLETRRGSSGVGGLLKLIS
ncbi:MAG: hypothetical protein CMC15_15835 [Flavobacteriaceae bacterium]|nr:hypothetical protein [Flavobacteriaceae bacterium]